MLDPSGGVKVEDELAPLERAVRDERPAERRAREAVVSQPSFDTKQASALLSAIIASSDDAIISKDLDGIITSWNESATRIFGYTAEEAIGRSITLLIPPDRLAEEPSILERLKRGERVDHFETVRQRKDGALLDISVTISPVRDAQGRIIGASKVARDISERKRAEKVLEKQRSIIDQLYRVGMTLSAELDLEKLLQAVTDAATNLSGAKFGAFFYEPTGSGDGVYQPFTISGAPREAFERFAGPGMPPPRVVRSDDATRDPRFDASLARGGVAQAVRSCLVVPVVGRKGTIFGALFLGHPATGVFMEDAERIACGLAAQAGIAVENAQLYENEQRLRMEAENANQAKDRFLAMLGHELRNPLSSVSNAAVAGSLDPSHGGKALEIVRRGADQLTRLVDDLLDVARITQGKVALRRGRVRLARVVEHAVETTRPMVEEKGLRLTTSLPDAWLEVDGDQTRLEQVVVNLIANAAKFTDPRGHIEVRAERVGREAVLRVRDDGVGIAAGLLPQIFDVFTQADAGLARTGGGLGIGLTVARQLIELHGGRIEARSEGPDRGAEFVVHLPALSGTTVSISGMRLPEAAKRGGARVLLVEDNEDARSSLVLLLEHFGHEVEMAGDGAAALDRARSFRPELMIVDIGLPGIDGYEVARQVRSRMGDSVVLIALTGYGGSEAKQRALESGFDYYFTKPIDPRVLRSLLEALPKADA